MKVTFPMGGLITQMEMMNRSDLTNQNKGVCPRGEIPGDFPLL
jgi:hypothetical protein